MPKKGQVRTVMDSQQLKGSKRVLQTGRQYFCHIFWSLWKEIFSKNSVLVVSEILRLFLNILTPDDKYSLPAKASVYRKQFKCNYLKIKKNFLTFLLHFWNLHKILNTLKKRLPLDGITFSKYRLQKAGLLKSVKSLVSEHLWTVNMLKGPKECLNLQGSIFVIPFDNSERKSARKPLFLVYLESSHIDTVS